MNRFRKSSNGTNTTTTNTTEIETLFVGKSAAIIASGAATFALTDVSGLEVGNFLTIQSKFDEYESEITSIEEGGTVPARNRRTASGTVVNTKVVKTKAKAGTVTCADATTVSFPAGSKIKVTDISLTYKQVRGSKSKKAKKNKSAKTAKSKKSKKSKKGGKKGKSAKLSSQWANAVRQNTGEFAGSLAAAVAVLTMVAFAVIKSNIVAESLDEITPLVDDATLTKKQFLTMANGVNGIDAANQSERLQPGTEVTPLLEVVERV